MVAIFPEKYYVKPIPTTVEYERPYYLPFSSYRIKNFTTKRHANLLIAARADVAK